MVVVIVECCGVSEWIVWLFVDVFVVKGFFVWMEGCYVLIFDVFVYFMGEDVVIDFVLFFIFFDEISYLYWL